MERDNISWKRASQRSYQIHQKNNHEEFTCVRRRSFIQDCEEHTVWMNDLLQSHHCIPSTDLRRSIADGLTLVNLVEILTNEKVEGVNEKPLSPKQKTNNLHASLQHLESNGVEIQNISPQELTDGNLKSTLQLMGQVRKRFDPHFDSSQSSSRPTSIAHARFASEPADLASSNSRSLTSLNQLPPRAPSAARNQELPLRSPAKDPSSTTIELLPGTLTEIKGLDMPPPRPLPMGSIDLHSSDYFTHSGSSSARSRPHSTTEAEALPPPAAGPAWANHQSPSRNRPQSAHPSGYTSKAPRTPSTKYAYQNAAYDPRHDEGELLVPPPPKPRPQNSSQDGIPVSTYIPSRPIDRPPSRTAQPPAPGTPRSQYRAGPNGDDSPPKYPAPPSYPGPQVSPGNNIRSTTSRAKIAVPCTTDIRSACTKMYSKDGLNYPQMAETPPFSPAPERQSYPCASPTGQRSSSPLGSQNSSHPSPNNGQTTAQHQHHVSWAPPKSPRDYESLRRDSQPNSARNSARQQKTVEVPHYTHLNKRSSYPDGQISKASQSDLTTKAVHQDSRTSGFSTTGSKSPTYANMQSLDIPKKDEMFIVTPHKSSEDLRKVGVKDKPFPASSSSTCVKTSTPTRPSRRGDKSRWRDSLSDSSSATPPLPALSPSQTPPMTPLESSTRRLRSKTNGSHGSGYMPNQTPDVVVSTSMHSKKKASRKNSIGLKFGNKTKKSSAGRSAQRGFFKQAPPLRNPRAIINTVDSPIDDDDDSFFDDQDSTTAASMTVTDEPQGNREMQTIHRQLHGLEAMYSEVLKLLGVDKEYLPGSRRSISSMSSTSRTGRSRRNHKHYRSRDLRHIEKRFARLESHVVTLARSVAHLSSEMRTQSSFLQELDDLKQEIEDLKTNKTQPQAPPLMSAEWERFRGWIPMITNPKRVQKLKRFFGHEPLLQIFLERLGYLEYLPNFEAEKISILELPYMNEERLEKIGLPMGPRQRILQEAQLCFRQENFNIYIV